MSAESKERQLIAASQTHAYFLPAKMEENSGDEIDSINLHNVWAGLQQFQAIKNVMQEEMIKGGKVMTIKEIFSEPNDLISLAKMVEMQAGIDGLIESYLATYTWTTWEIYPQLPNLTEIVYGVPHISLGISVEGVSLKAVSIKDVKLNEEKSDLVKCPPQLLIYMGDEKSIDDRHKVLPNFRLGFINVTSDKKGLVLGGEEDFGDEKGVQEPERTFLTFILRRNGILKFGEEKRTDQLAALIKKKQGGTDGPVLINKDEIEKRFQWEKIRELLLKDEAYSWALCQLLLPYCDMPTEEGHYYVLSEDNVPKEESES